MNYSFYMHVLYKDLYNAEQSRRLDRCAIEEHGRAGYTLMLSAGTALFDCYRQQWPLARRILVLAGPGNNGGDGYVVAGLAAEAGHDVSLIGFGEPAAGGDADRFRQQWLAAGGEVADPAEFDSSDQHIARYDLVVDALLGTGLSRAPAQPMAIWIEAVNRSQVPCIAVDVPSGLDSDTGAIPGVAIAAQSTVTFIGRKQGLYTGHGPQQCGNIQFADLGVPAAIYASISANSRLITAGSRHLPMFPPRLRGSHKGDFGHLLLIAGGEGMAGAAIIAGSAALRAGSGLVSLAVHPSNAAAVVNARPEMMVHGVQGADDLTPLLERADVVAIGPGLGQKSWAQQLWQALEPFKGPMVVDADGLNLLAQSPAQRHNWVLTPHTGEAGRLLSSSVEEIERNRFVAVSALHQKYSGTVVLKGAGTLIQSNETLPTVIDGGNPGMASGGMGDALTGIIGAFLAQGLDTEDAATLGVAAHAWAGDRVASEHGERGMLASDLIDDLPETINGTQRFMKSPKSTSGKLEHLLSKPEENGSAHSIFSR